MLLFPNAEERDYVGPYGVFANAATETLRLTDGRGVHVVYDSVGKTTLSD